MMGQMQNEVGQTVKTVVLTGSWTALETAAATDTVKVNGRCTQIEFKVAENTTNNITFTLAAASPLSGTLYTLAAIADNGTTVLKLQSATTNIGQWIANGDVLFTITPSGAPGATGATVTANLQFE